MLYPQANELHQCQVLPDIWEFLLDPDDIGRTAGWSAGMVGAMPTVEVRGTQILFNGEPVVLRGFGRHEYFPITGRGFVPTMIMDALNK